MLISIVTVNFNDALGLSKTIETIKNQLYKKIEFIIIDGLSNDDSISIINSNLKYIDKWISEKDEGIYDAMNKGIALSTGDFLIFLNSGDTFYSNDVLRSFKKKVMDFEKVYFGRAQICASENKNWFFPSYKFDESNINNWISKNLPNHQAMFFPKIFYKNHEYSLKYKIASDADYKFKAINYCGISFVDIKVCNFYLGGVSSSFNSFKKIRLIAKESKMINSKFKSKREAYIRVFNIYIKFFISSFGNTFFSFILNFYRKK